MKISALLVTAALAAAALSPTAMADSARTGRGAADQARTAATVETFGYRSAGRFDADAHRLETRQLADWLTAEMAADALEAPLRISLSRDEAASLEQPVPGSPRLRVGVVKPVGRALDLSGLPAVSDRGDAQLPLGSVRRTADGGYVWSLAVQSPGATALRLRFTSFELPPQAAVWIHDLDGAAHGPYTKRGPDGNGDFWSHNTLGDLVVVELRHSGPVTAEQLATTSLTLADVGHSGPLFTMGRSSGPAKSFCTFNADCIENAECHGSGDFGSMEDAQDAVALIQFVSGPFLYTCTGGLLVDTDDSSDIPHFLTANHCVSKGREASTLETFFRFTAACGTSACPGVPAYSTRGSQILRTNRTGDYTLLQLNESPPAGSFFLGWNNAAVANSNGQALHRISHPSGAPQAYSAHAVDASAPTCSSWPRGSWIYSRDTLGATEGGSSGSPVMNAAGQVVGQLSGGCGTNVYEECDAVNNATVDGAFASYWPEVAPFLDPSGDCTPSPEDCANGTDDDCDGAVDCADSDCAGDPACSSSGCNLGGNGDPCDTGGDCCSGNCRNNRCRGN